jgi:hypothetical protein
MTEMETFAIAARLHVVLRRAHGRVTDVEWMTRNREYAREVIRIAREHTEPELLELADKFEASLVAQRAGESAPRRAPAQDAPRPGPVPHVMPAVPRYVGRLR